MAVLRGWKEIADHLRLGVRTAQRWERFGLPVRRVSQSSCSPVVAMSDEIEQWARIRKTKTNSYGTPLETSIAKFRVTRRKTRKLVKQLDRLRHEQERLLGSLEITLLPPQG